MERKSECSKFATYLSTWSRPIVLCKGRVLTRHLQDSNHIPPPQEALKFPLIFPLAWECFCSVLVSLDGFAVANKQSFVISLGIAKLRPLASFGFLTSAQIVVQPKASRTCPVCHLPSSASTLNNDRSVCTARHSQVEGNSHWLRKAVRSGVVGEGVGRPPSYSTGLAVMQCTSERRSSLSVCTYVCVCTWVYIYIY